VRQRKASALAMPRGTAMAFLHRGAAGAAGADPPGPPSNALHGPDEAGLRAFCAAGASLVAELARARKQSRDDAASRDLHSWLFRQLSSLGPKPDADPDLYRLLHQSLDELESSGALAPDAGFHCRLCLGYQETKRGMPVVMDRGRKLCQWCCR